MAQIAKIAIENAVYAIDKPYDYLIPEGMTVCAGMRVTVPFGRGNRRSEGMVLCIVVEFYAILSLLASIMMLLNIG